MLAVGHVPGTALPGGRGNAVFAGHRDTLFRPLAHASDHDTISIFTPYGSYSYEIISREVVDPNRIDFLDPNRLQGVTLVTCYPFQCIGRAPKRFVITARQIESTSGLIPFGCSEGPATANP